MRRARTIGVAPVARLSPLKHRNLNLLGRYSFTASLPTAGALRPLRDPDAAGLDEDDEEERPSWRLLPRPGSLSGRGAPWRVRCTSKQPLPRA